MTPFKVTENTREAFTNGDCWALALAVRQLTGLPLVFSSPDPDGYDEDPEFLWDHVAVTLPDGTVLDVDGIEERERWADSWGSFDLLITADSELIDGLTNDQTRRYPNVNARALARRLLNHYNIPTTGRRHRDAVPI
jgi:hypothetical protein